MSDDNFTTINVWHGEHHLQVLGVEHVMSQAELDEMQTALDQHYGARVELRVDHVRPVGLIGFLEDVAAFSKKSVPCTSGGEE